MSDFSEMTEIVRKAVDGLPERKAEFEVKSAERRILSAARTLRDVIGEPGISDIAERLGVIDAYQALPDNLDIPALPPEPRLSDEVMQTAQKVRDALKVADLLNLDETDIGAAKEVLGVFDANRPTSTPSGNRGTRRSSGNTPQSGREGVIYANITQPDGNVVSRSNAASRPDSGRMAFREVIGDVGDNKDEGFKSAYSAAQAFVLDNPGVESDPVNHPNGGNLTLRYEPADA